MKWITREHAKIEARKPQPEFSAGRSRPLSDPCRESSSLQPCSVRPACSSSPPAYKPQA